MRVSSGALDRAPQTHTYTVGDVVGRVVVCVINESADPAREDEGVKLRRCDTPHR